MKKWKNLGGSSVTMRMPTLGWTPVRCVSMRALARSSARCTQQGVLPQRKGTGCRKAVCNAIRSKCQCCPCTQRTSHWQPGSQARGGVAADMIAASSCQCLHHWAESELGPKARHAACVQRAADSASVIMPARWTASHRTTCTLAGWSRAHPEFATWP